MTSNGRKFLPSVALDASRNKVNILFVVRSEHRNSTRTEMF